MSTTSPDPRRQLAALWDTLDSLGAVVRRANLDDLPDDVIEALATHQARRIRVLIEGEAAGWSPDWRHRPTQPEDNHAAALRAVTDPPTTSNDGSQSEPPERPAPIQVRHHQPRWRSIA